jgi:hypothetical protein
VGKFIFVENMLKGTLVAEVGERSHSTPAGPALLTPSCLEKWRIMVLHQGTLYCTVSNAKNYKHLGTRLKHRYDNIYRPRPSTSPYVQTLSHLNWLTALRWRGSNSISVSGHNNIRRALSVVQYTKSQVEGGGRSR